MSSAVHRGTAFERRSLQLLQTNLSMALRRIGGKSDGGVDLVGWWWLPITTDPAQRPGALPDAHGLLRRRLRVLVQCKAEKRKFSLKYVREMEGVWHLHAASAQVYPTVAVLVSQSPFSDPSFFHARSSTVPFLLIQLPEPGGIYNSFACPNPTLARLVNPLAFRWERNPSQSETDPHKCGRPGLWWNGRRLHSWAPSLLDPDTSEPHAHPPSSRE